MMNLWFKVLILFSFIFIFIIIFIGFFLVLLGLCCFRGIDG